jgi:AcrR family transcriptional regulator
VRRTAQPLRLHPTIERRIEQAPIALLRSMRAEEITVEDIARVAGISSDTVRIRYERPEEVFIALPDRHLHRLCRRLQARPRHEPILDALIATLTEDDLTDQDEESIATWARVVLPAVPTSVTGQALDILSAFQQVTSVRTGRPSSDVHVQAWGTAIAAISVASFERWMVHGGDRSQHFVDGLEQLQLLALT